MSKKPAGRLFRTRHKTQLWARYYGTAKVLTQQFRHVPPVSSYIMPRNQNLYGCLPSFRYLGNTKLPSFAVAWPANLQSCYTLHAVA